MNRPQRSKKLDPNKLGVYVDWQLIEHRPDRYEVGDTSWREPVYAQIAALIPEREAKLVAAKQFIDQREGMATRQANQRLRDIGRTGNWPDSWDDELDGHHPIAVGDVRVCLRAATADDLRSWAIDERRRASQDFAARVLACDGAEWVADQMDASGWPTLGEAIKRRLDGAA